MGVSHFLEHMMFKGTARRSAEDVNREFDELGANYNAFTSHEQTVYYAHILPEFFPRAVDLLGDMLRPALREPDFDMEKNVILEEIGMYDDRPEWRLQDKLLEDYFGDHPLGFRVLGTTDTIKQLTAAQMRDYFAGRYSPDNIVVAAAGNLDFSALLSDCERLCGHWPATGVKRDLGQAVATDQQLTVDDARLSRHYLGLLCPAPSAQDPRRYAAKVLADLLGDGDGSRLHWAIVDPGLADEADFSFMPQDGSGAYLAYTSCDPAAGGSSRIDPTGRARRRGEAARRLGGGSAADRQQTRHPGHASGRTPRGSHASPGHPVDLPRGLHPPGRRTRPTHGRHPRRRPRLADGLPPHPPHPPPHGPGVGR